MFLAQELLFQLTIEVKNANFYKTAKIWLKALIDLLDFGQYCNNTVKLLVILSKISASWKLVLIHCYVQIKLKLCAKSSLSVYHLYT